MNTLKYGLLVISNVVFVTVLFGSEKTADIDMVSGETIPFYIPNMIDGPHNNYSNPQRFFPQIEQADKLHVDPAILHVPASPENMSTYDSYQKKLKINQYLRRCIERYASQPTILSFFTAYFNASLPNQTIYEYCRSDEWSEYPIHVPGYWHQQIAYKIPTQFKRDEKNLITIASQIQKIHERDLVYQEKVYTFLDILTEEQEKAFEPKTFDVFLKAIMLSIAKADESDPTNYYHKL